MPPEIAQFHFKSKNEKTGIPGNTRKFAEYLAAEKPDVILSSFIAANVTAAAGRMIAPEAQQDTPLIVRQITDYNRHLNNPVIKGLLHFAYKAADQVVAICHDMESQIFEAMNYDNIKKVKTVYPPSLDTAITEKATETTGISWLDDRDSGNSDLQVIVGVGRLAKQKDFPTLIDAFAKTVKERTNARLVIVGEGPEREKLEEQIKKLGLEGKVALPGYTANPYAFIDKADVFALTSKYEGLGKVVVESIALGTRAVVSDCKVGPGEVARVQPESQIFPVNDADAAADCLIRALDAAKQPGSRKVPVPDDLSKHTLGVVVSQFAEMADQLIAKRQYAQSLRASTKINQSASSALSSVATLLVTTAQPDDNTISEVFGDPRHNPPVQQWRDAGRDAAARKLSGPSIGKSP